MERDFSRTFSGDLAASRRPFAWLRLPIDWPLLLLLLILCGGGLVALHSALDQDRAALNSQLVKVLLAFAVMLLLARINPAIYLRFIPLAYLAVLLMLGAVLLFGTEIKGSRRWLKLPYLGGFQPSELMKLVLPMLLAWFFRGRHLPPRLWELLLVAVLILLPVLLVAEQPDLGTAILIGSSGLLVVWLAGIPWRYIWTCALLLLAGTPLFWLFMHDYQRSRVLTLFNPEQDPLGSGWSIIQSMTAIGSGGIFGKGLLQGSQSRLEFLPESQTDFIIAVIAEETGLVGVLTLVFLYLLVVVRCVLISMQARDTFGRLLAGSLTFTFFIYVFVNIGMVSGILPVVGVPLPLISYGGTSVVTLLAGFGLIMSVHSHRQIMR